MGDLDREHQRRDRAEQVREQLGVLWGEGLPPGPDGLRTLVVDALGLDDELGARRQVVTRADGLTYPELAELLRRANTGEGTEGVQLPTRLLVPLATLLKHPGGTPTWAPLPLGRDSGAWDYDVNTDSVGWDAVCAQRMGSDRGAQRMPLAQAMLAVHPDDRPRVARSLEKSATTGAAYFERYRGLLPDGASMTVLAQARVCGAVGDTPRLAGFLTT